MPSRRHLLILGAGSLVIGVRPGFANQQPLLECTPGVATTERQTEGPFFRGGSPQRSELIGQRRGQRIELTGLVMSRTCRPVVGAVVDLWHADTDGRYDNSGYELRGHQITNERGFWHFDTIAPASYPGRTRHYHVKVTPPGGRTLTTQLYFPGDAGNARDSLYRPSLQLETSNARMGMAARFNFIVEV